jgi:MFS transporter, DHA2 family, multidrug resistance protein
MSTTDRARIHERRWWILVALSMSLLIVIIDDTIINVALPTLQRELGASTTALQWIVDAYIVVFAGLLLTMGSLGDRFGRKRLLS